ncbi:MAG TPA: flagellar biosynthesis protein FlgL [Xanthobacteraceae bacterium]|nr:flagellar biosynthesis protein FlgL [Xanthobacteraceae bacterium]
MSTITGLTSNAMLQAQMLVQMQQQLNNLSQQLSTGKQAQTYAGLGIQRGLDVNVRGTLSRLSAYQNSITTVSTNVQLQNTALNSLNQMTQDLRTATLQPIEFTLVARGQTNTQIEAGSDLDQALSVLNTQAGNTYLFSGRATNTPATDTADHILNGNGTAAGLKQVISERLQADQGSDGRGRLQQPTAAGDVVTLTEDSEDPSHPFGFQIAGASTSIAGATVTGPSGSPPSLSIDFGGTNPPDGSTVQIQFTLPDGTSSSISLTASSAVPTPAGSFAIGATAADTATNLANAIDSQIQTLAKTDLAAASAVQASNEFFNIDASHPPLRVNGPPFDSATGLRNATATDTVRWYTGDDATDDPRSTMSARVDDSITVNYGIRANEEAIRNSVQNFATFAAMTFPASDPTAQDRYNALAARVGDNLAPSTTKQQISAIQTEIAGANDAANAAKTRIDDKTPILQGVLDNIENADPNSVGAQLLTLQTQMSASLQTTAMLAKLSLVNFM